MSETNSAWLRKQEKGPDVAENFSLFGRDLFGDAVQPKGRGPLAKRFEFPPFSVLDARSGEWQERKRAWLTLGIQSEVGRDSNTQSGKQTAGIWSGTGHSGALQMDVLAGKQETATAVSQRLAPGGGGCWLGGPKTASSEKFGMRGNTHSSANAMAYAGGFEQNAVSQSGTSIFDPVLCELAYRWFCPPGGQVVDPFAGGSVRGVVASCLGRPYWGCDLRPEQIAANEEQRAAIDGAGLAVWAVGDAREALKNAPTADFIFSCPPYGDLERYSDDPRDLSTLDYAAFCAAYREIITAALARLKPDRFAAFVVGEYRDQKTGFYRGFVPYTCAAFVAAGAAYYNEAILVTSVGSLPVRAGKQFAAGRKLGKTHQQLLVFVKGDPKRAAAACGAL